MKRALLIDGRDYVITIDPTALKLTEKGRRLGLELKWAELVRGESALAMALQASVGKFESDRRAPTPAPLLKRPKPESKSARRK